MKFVVFCAVLATLVAAQETATVEGVVVNKVTGAGIGGPDSVSPPQLRVNHLPD